MVWNIFDAKWEKAYALAAAYYEENGHLNIPRSYVTAAGERLGQWVASQQWAYPKGKTDGGTGRAAQPDRDVLGQSQ